MASDELWTATEESDWAKPKRTFSAIHLSMLFATAVIAVTVVMTPVLSGKSDVAVVHSGDALFDNIVTGSIGKSRTGVQKTPNFAKKQYTIRHSITQSSAEACVIYDNGRESGGC